MRDFERVKYVCSIDLKPALDESVLDARLLRELGENANRGMGNLLGSLVPKAMIPVLLARAGIPGEKKAHNVTREERRRLLEALKHFTVPVSGPRPIEEAIITSGGIKVGEVDPKTMQSKKVPGLFFAGELLDVDAYTGGFNLQICGRLYRRLQPPDRMGYRPSGGERGSGVYRGRIRGTHISHRCRAIIGAAYRSMMGRLQSAGRPWVRTGRSFQKERMSASVWGTSKTA